MPRKGAMPLLISSQRSLGPEPLTVTTAGKGPFPTGRTIVPCRLMTPLELHVVTMGECVSMFLRRSNMVWLVGLRWQARERHIGFHDTSRWSLSTHM